MNFVIKVKRNAIGLGVCLVRTFRARFCMLFTMGNMYSLRKRKQTPSRDYGDEGAALKQ